MRSRSPSNVSGCLPCRQPSDERVLALLVSAVLPRGFPTADLPGGLADMILAVEPLEALRYVHYLGERGTIVASTVPFVNIPDYPPIEQVLEKIPRFPKHVLVDADRLARARVTELRSRRPSCGFARNGQGSVFGLSGPMYGGRPAA